MDWKLFSATFVTVFLAEFGDKTQLAAMVASAQAKSTLTVLIAACAALCVATVLGVAVGRLLQGVLNEKILHYAAGIAFIGMGFWLLVFRP